MTTAQMMIAHHGKMGFGGINNDLTLLRVGMGKGQEEGFHRGAMFHEKGSALRRCHGAKIGAMEMTCRSTEHWELGNLPLPGQKYFSYLV